MKLMKVGVGIRRFRFFCCPSACNRRAVAPAALLVGVAVSLHFSDLKSLGDQVEIGNAAVDLNLHGVEV